MERLNSLFALLLIVFLCSLAAGDNGQCNFENGKTGAKWCKDGFTLSFNKVNDKQAACCLSYNMAQCIQHSYVKARCRTTDKKMEGLVSEEVENAQKEVGKLSSALGSFACDDDLSDSKCRNFADEFYKVEARINQLNGASIPSSTITPFMAVACFIIVLLYS